MPWMTLVMGVLYWEGLLSQLTTVPSLSMLRDIRRKLGFQPLMRPDRMLSTVFSGDVIQSELSYPQRKMSSTFTPRPIQGVPAELPFER